MRPVTPHPFAMTWRAGLFLHWSFDPEQIRPHVPEPLELDIRDGRAWVSVLPFVLADAGFRGTPSTARLTFPELNFRTYVHYDGWPGLYFFSIDVGHPVARAIRAVSRLPCYRARMRVRTGPEASREAEAVRFRGVRDAPGEPDSRFDATYRPTGEVRRPEPGSLSHWLVERRGFFASRGPGVMYGEISHHPWPLQPADVEIRTNDLFADSALPEPDDEPVAYYADDLPMTGSVLRRIPEK